MARFEVELAAAHGIKMEVSKREPVEQTVIDPILALFAHMQLRLLTPVFLQRSLTTAFLHCGERLPVA
jgi:hypothetical protein